MSIYDSMIKNNIIGFLQFCREKGNKSISTDITWDIKEIIRLYIKETYGTDVVV